VLLLQDEPGGYVTLEVPPRDRHVTPSLPAVSRGPQPGAHALFAQRARVSGPLVAASLQHVPFARGPVMDRKSLPARPFA
jgi:hypothetical protein